MGIEHHFDSSDHASDSRDGFQDNNPKKRTVRFERSLKGKVIDFLTQPEWFGAFPYDLHKEGISALKQLGESFDNPNMKPDEVAKVRNRFEEFRLKMADYRNKQFSSE